MLCRRPVYAAILIPLFRQLPLMPPTLPPPAMLRLFCCFRAARFSPAAADYATPLISSRLLSSSGPARFSPGRATPMPLKFQPLAADSAMTPDMPLDAAMPFQRCFAMSCFLLPWLMPPPAWLAARLAILPPDAAPLSPLTIFASACRFRQLASFADAIATTGFRARAFRAIAVSHATPGRWLPLPALIFAAARGCRHIDIFAFLMPLPLPARRAAMPAITMADACLFPPFSQAFFMRRAESRELPFFMPPPPSQLIRQDGQPSFRH